MNNFEKKVFWRLFLVMITASVLMLHGCTDEPSFLLQAMSKMFVKTTINVG